MAGCKPQNTRQMISIRKLCEPLARPKRNRGIHNADTYMTKAFVERFEQVHKHLPQPLWGTRK